jgi:hypothetical protein
VLVTLEYAPPAGGAGAIIARMLGEEPEKQIHDDLRRFKQIMEVGEISTVLGQTSGRLPEVEKERAQLRQPWRGGGRSAEAEARKETAKQSSGEQEVGK